MVTYFNRKDLVKFGVYLLSEERKKRFDDAYKQMIRDGINNPLSTEERLKQVHHADVENWINDQNNR